MEAYEMVIAHKVQIFGLAMYKHRAAIRKALELACMGDDEDIEIALVALSETERELATVR